jgi:DNA mismatch repair ATPase MutL
MVSAPTVSRSARDGMHITVNGRAILARGPISAMIEEAYHTLLMKGRFPIVVLQIQVHPAAVDVNVHPTKSEVKFRQPELVGYTLGRAVRAALQDAVVIQNWQPKADGPAADATPAEAPMDVMAPPIADELNAAALPPATPAAPESDPLPYAVAHTAEADDDLFPAPGQPADTTPIQAALLVDQPQYDQPLDRRPAMRLAESGWMEPAADGNTYTREQDMDAARRLAALQAIAQQPLAPHDPTTASAPTQPPAISTPRETSGHPDRPAPRLPALRALAQLAQTYLLTEGPEGALYLIDQHAAHERITYERLLAQHAAGVLESQALLLPQHVALPPPAQQALLGAADELATWGFTLDEGEGGVNVLAVPTGLRLESLATTLTDLASHIGGGRGETPTARRDAMLATLACHTSVRAGQTLTTIEQQALIDQLAGCDGPRTCPHGRPTLIVVTKYQLEHQFGRLGA